MTDIEKKALALVNEIERERGEDELTPRIMRGLIMDEALCRAIEQHEAFRQEVSDVAEEVVQRQGKLQALLPFIIPAPKSDPLVFAMDELKWCNTDALAKDLRDTLDALGFEIREKNDD